MLLFCFLATTAVCVLFCTVDAFQSTSIHWKQRRCGHPMYFDESETFGSENSSNSNKEKEDPSVVSRGSWKEDWGVSYTPDEKRLPFPSSIDSLSKEIVDTIHAELRDLREFDPSILHNLQHEGRILRHRPVRHPHRDKGRIGIEVEGEDLLLVALTVAYRLGQERVPIVVYLNTINEALLASWYFQLFKSRAAETDDYTKGPCDYIQLCTLHDATIPRAVATSNEGKIKENIENGLTGSPEGYLIVVQPAGPIDGLQKVVAHATLNAFPVILLSPRMNHWTPTPWDQSGFQQSAFYGGSEPPRGPTPWLMRDFTPPILSWIVADNYSLWHTVRHPSHTWDIFSRTHRGFEYIASTKKTAGRPTLWLLDKILNGL